MLVAWIAVALAWRAPWFAFSDLNWDTSLYRLGADALLQGHLPYVTVWDRKPAGLFVLVAMVEWLGGAVALHVAAAVGVGIGAWLLAELARRMLPPAAGAGVLAAGLWVVFAGSCGGTGMNAELFFMPLNLAGLWLLLRGGEDARRLLGAGLLFGIAFQVKYNAGFVVPPFLLAWLVFAGPARFWRGVAFVAAGAALPSLAVLAWFGLAGQLDVWISANVVAHAPALAAAWRLQAPDMAALPYLLRRYDLPLAGAALAVAWSIQGGWRLPAVLATWLAAEAMALWAMGRVADHMMIPLLPPLCLAAGYGVARSIQAAGRHRLAVAVVLALAWLGWSGREMARPFAAAVEIVARRHAAGTPDWGDPSATAGHLLAARLAPGEAIYVFGGPVLGVYLAAGRPAPTRFPFVEHLWSGYAPVDGVAELERVLATRPAYIAVAARWLSGGEVPTGAGPVFAVLHQGLARDYVAEATVAPFVSRGGGPIGPREAIALFRRADRTSAN